MRRTVYGDLLHTTHPGISLPAGYPGTELRLSHPRPDASGEYEGALHGSTRGGAQERGVAQHAGSVASAMRPGYDPWEHPPRFDDDRAGIATAGNFINNRVAFPARTRGESSFEEERGDETGNKTRLPVDQNREAGEGCASALREQETLSCDDVISILPGPVSGFPDRQKALKGIQPDSQKRGMTFRTGMRNQTKHGR